MITVQIDKNWQKIDAIQDDSVFCVVVEKNDIVQIALSENDQIPNEIDSYVYIKSFEKETIKPTAKNIFVRTMNSKGTLTISSEVFK